MRGFHLKMYPESGVPEIEVISAEVCLHLHQMQLVPITFLVRFGTMVQTSSVETNLMSLTQCCGPRHHGAGAFRRQKWWLQALAVDA
jgi:hypothetical protein